MDDDAKILRTEMGAIHEERLKVFQTGITLLLALETALYYLRRDVLEHLRLDAEHNHAAPPYIVPWDHSLIGTAILAIVATIFTLLTWSISRRYRFLRNEYKARYPKELPLPTINPISRYLAIFCYLLFPVMDFGIQTWLRSKVMFDDVG